MTFVRFAQNFCWFLIVGLNSSLAFNLMFLSEGFIIKSIDCIFYSKKEVILTNDIH